MGASKSEVHRAVWKDQNSGRSLSCSLGTELLLLQETSGFALKNFQWVGQGLSTGLSIISFTSGHLSVDVNHIYQHSRIRG